MDDNKTRADARNSHIAESADIHASLKRGLEQSARGETYDLGSFAPYADDTEQNTQTAHAAIAADLVLTDALTSNHDGTPEYYIVDVDNVEYLVAVVLELAAGRSEQAAVERAADAMESVIAHGDVAEVAAPVSGEVGRSAAVARRDALYEDPPGWLRGYAAAMADDNTDHAPQAAEDRPAPTHASTAFDRPPGNVYVVPDDGGTPLADVSARPAIIAPTDFAEDGSPNRIGNAAAPPEQR